MGAITDRDLRNQITGNKIGRFYLLYGDESYQKGLYLKKLTEQVLSGSDESWNKSYTTGKNFSLRWFEEETSRLPVFSHRRVVVVEDFTSYGEEGIYDKMEEIISSSGDSTVFIFYQHLETLDIKKNKGHKAFVGFADKMGFSVNFSLKDDRWLRDYLQSELKKRGLTVSPAVADKIVRNSSGEMYFLLCEADKLKAYVGTGEVTEEIADKVCAKSVEASKYDLAKYIANRNAVAAIHEIDNLLFMGVDASGVLSGISSLFFDMYIVSSAGLAGKNKADILSDFKGYKNRDFVIDNATRYLKNYDRAQTEKALRLIIDAEDILHGGSKIDKKLLLEKTAVEIMKV